MSQQDTFNKLKQIPIDEMIEKFSQVKRLQPVYQIGNLNVDTRDYYSDMRFHLERITVLEEHGWDYKDFLLALEKRAILTIIKDFNDSMEFPQDLLDRAKRFFPNAKFTKANIELE